MLMSSSSPKHILTLTFHVSYLTLASLPAIKRNGWILSLAKRLSENQPLRPGSTIQYLCEIV